MVDVVNLYIIDVKGARKNLNISKKYLRDSLRKKMKKVETQDIWSKCYIYNISINLSLLFLMTINSYHFLLIDIAN